MFFSEPAPLEVTSGTDHLLVNRCHFAQQRLTLQMLHCIHEDSTRPEDSFCVFGPGASACRLQRKVLSSGPAAAMLSGFDLMTP